MTIASDKIQSDYSVSETVSRLEQYLLQQRGNKIFSLIDHTKEAVNVGKTLTEIKVILFGNPDKGTELMQENPEIALDLPLRIVVWLDIDNITWVRYTDPVKIALYYNIKNQNLAKAMTNALYDTILSAIKNHEK